MNRLVLLCLSALAALPALAQPAITAIENAATNIQPGLPNAPIAQGALFVVKGSNLGPSTLAIATSFPLQTTLGGTSIQVTVGGSTVNAIMYYALGAQVAAILPSATPTGTGTLKLTTATGNATSPISVVKNNIGMFTIATTGSGDAVATLATNNTVITPTNAPNPGDVIALWSTGLGPVTSDETMPAQQVDMPSIPLQVWVAGKQAPVLFRGRNACCTAVDTVYISIPAGVSGCAASVIMQIGTGSSAVTSNATTIPIATSGRTCTPTNPALSPSAVQSLLAKGGPLSVGGISLTRTISTGLSLSNPLAPPSTTKSDSGSARFVKYSAPASAVLDSIAIETLSYGSCTLLTFQGITPDPLAGLGPTYLDAGPSLAMSNGLPALTKTSSQGGILYSAKFDSTATTLNAGSYTVTGPGGPDVGAFNVTVNVPTPLNWTNQSQITSVNRSSGLTVKWTGGDPNGYVFIQGFSAYLPSGIIDATQAIAEGFNCAAKTTDGTFTVPSYVLNALPPSGSIFGITVPGVVQLIASSTPVPFQATGLDFALATNTVLISSTVPFQ